MLLLYLLNISNAGWLQVDVTLLHSPFTSILADTQATNTQNPQFSSTPP